MPYREKEGILNPNDVQLKNYEYPIDYIIKMIKYGEIEVYENIDNTSISDKEKSLLIESILLNIPIAPIYFEENISNYTERKLKPIRGHSILKTIKEFTIDRSFCLTELEFLPSINERGYEDLPNMYRRRIFTYVLNVVLLKAGTSDLAKYAIYKRLNAQEKLLTTEQIEYIIRKDSDKYQVVQKIIEVIKSSNLFWNEGVSDLELEEMASRYIIFQNEGYLNFYTPFNVFKNKKIQEYSYSRRKLIRFGTTLDFIRKEFGTSLFKINKKFYPSLFEVWSVLLDKYRNSIEFNDEIYADIAKLYRDNEFIKSIKTDSKKNIEIRFDKVKNLIKGM